MTRALEDLSSCLQEPCEPVLAGAVPHPGHCWQRKETVTWVLTAGQGASPPLVLPGIPEGGGWSQESFPPSRLAPWQGVPAVRFVPFSAAARQQPLSLCLSGREEGRLLPRAEGREESQPRPLWLLSLVSQLFVFNARFISIVWREFHQIQMRSGAKDNILKPELSGI